MPKIKWGVCIVGGICALLFAILAKAYGAPEWAAFCFGTVIGIQLVTLACIGEARRENRK